MVSTHADGRINFRVYLPSAASVELVGTFTRWKAGKVAMTRQEPGWWEAALPVPGGEHEFCYLVDGCLWIADYAAHGVRMSSQAGWVSRLQAGQGGVSGDAQAA